uniref:Uncharacterized protein n=1 Tax=virus sp. ctEfN2 TaxID=2825810 RepID=A0A8S5RMB5_9VIRU|nr:MAG TPA: hypothetical protein [virus sp. ctEfN2]
MPRRRYAARIRQQKPPGLSLRGFLKNSCELDVILLIFAFQYGSTLNNVKFYNTFYIPIWDY